VDQEVGLAEDPNGPAGGVNDWRGADALVDQQGDGLLKRRAIAQRHGRSCHQVGGRFRSEFHTGTGDRLQ